MKPHATLQERGIAKPGGKRRASKMLNGAHASKRTSKSITTAQRKQIIGEWLELVNWAETVTSHAFAGLTMSHLWMIHKKIEIPPCKGSEGDKRIDDFAHSMASMIFNLFVEIGAPSDQELWQNLLGGTVIECLGPRPQGQPRSYASAYPVRMPQLEAREGAAI